MARSGAAATMVPWSDLRLSLSYCRIMVDARGFSAEAREGMTRRSAKGSDLFGRDECLRAVQMLGAESSTRFVLGSRTGRVVAGGSVGRS